MATPEPTATINVELAYDCSVVDISLVDDQNGWAIVDCVVSAGNRHPHKGLVYRLTKGRWQLVPEAPVLGPSYSCYRAISAVSSEEMWAVGISGGQYVCEYGIWLLHYKNGKWETLDLDHLFKNRSIRLMDIEMVDTDNGWAISQYSILRYQKGLWSVESEVPRNDYDGFGLVAIGMAGLTDGWVAGNRRFYRYQDGKWTPWKDPPFESVWIWDIQTISAGEAWAVGFRGIPSNVSRAVPRIWHYTDGDWQEIAPPVEYDEFEYGELIDIKMINSEEGWAVGTGRSGLMIGSLILHYSNGRWQTVSGPSGYASLSVDALNSEHVWIGADKFYLYQLDVEGQYRLQRENDLAPGGYWP